jgi:hypothetical protein
MLTTVTGTIAVTVDRVEKKQTNKKYKNTLKAKTKSACLLTERELWKRGGGGVLLS